MDIWWSPLRASRGGRPYLAAPGIEEGEEKKTGAPLLAWRPIYPDLEERRERNTKTDTASRKKAWCIICHLVLLVADAAFHPALRVAFF